MLNFGIRIQARIVRGKKLHDRHSSAKVIDRADFWAMVRGPKRETQTNPTCGTLNIDTYKGSPLSRTRHQQSNLPLVISSHKSYTQQHKPCHRANRQAKHSDLRLEPPHPTSESIATCPPRQMSSGEQTINLPQLFVLTLIGFLALRWYFSSRTPSTANARNDGVSRVNPAHVEQLLQMFPQLDRRTVMWELQRNGGNVQIVTEKVLMGRALERVSVYSCAATADEESWSDISREQPPPSFQPPMPATPASTTARPAEAQSKSLHPDLITKYNLSARLAAEAEASGSETAAEAAGKKQAWSANKDERKSLLQKRREEMILAARRKLEEKDRAAAATAKS